MVVQHNILGMNANRQLNITSGIKAKSSEKLSSGYRINRAADDAAGLAISEKMRRQIRGLNQASANAQDGISFVQIADGALHEVHDMLQRGNELAVKAANDTLTDEDRSYIDAEIVKLREEIDSVGAKTNFNEIPIFPKNGSTIGGSSSVEQELVDMIAEDMIPNAVSQIVDKLNSSLGGTLTDLANTNPKAYGMDLNISYIDGSGGTLAYMSAAFSDGNPGKDAFASETLLMKVDSEDFSSATMSDEDKQVLESTIAHELMHGVMDVTLSEGMYRKDTSDSDYNFPLWFIEGTAQLVGGGFTTGWNDSIISIVNNDSLSDAGKLSNIASYLDNYTVEDRVYGHGYLECAYLCQLVSSNGISGTVDQSSLLDGANKIFNALMTNESNYPAQSFEAVINDLLTSTGKTLSGTISEMNLGATDAATFVLALANASKPASGDLFGAGSIIADSLNSVNILGSGASEDQPMYVENTSSSSATDSEETVIYLQVGSETTDENEIGLKRFAMSAAAIGLGITNTLTRTEALEAIGHFKSALINVSAMRSYYGAMQNRLEHTVKNLDNVVENTTAAESQIRDTDMAAEMVKYSNQNILAQAGQSMLAQANQTNQGVLSLLQ